MLLTHQNYIFIHVNNKYIKNSIKAVLEESLNVIMFLSE